MICEASATVWAGRDLFADPWDGAEGEACAESESSGTARMSGRILIKWKRGGKRSIQRFRRHLKGIQCAFLLEGKVTVIPMRRKAF